MNKIICPKCGEITKYYMLERVHRGLIFNADGEPCGATEDITEYVGIPRCLKCDKKIKINKKYDNVDG